MRKRKPSALGYLIRQDHALAEDHRGLAISTYGKVIRRGWDWLGMTPTAPERIGGLIEVPELAACLTLNKGDFIRTGARGATYLAFRKAIQQAVAKQLGEWGDAPPASDQAPPREVRPLQRDLVHLLEDLADDFRCSQVWSNAAPAGKNDYRWRRALITERREVSLPLR